MTGPVSHTRSDSEPTGPFASGRGDEPSPRIKRLVALLLRIGLGVSLLNGGLLGYLSVRRGGPTAGLPWSTLLGPAVVAGILEHDLLVPFAQIAIGLALILGFFTVASAVLAGFLILSGPLFQFLAILSISSQGGEPNLAMQAVVATGSINLLLLVSAVLWLTPTEGTPWSLDALIYARGQSGGRRRPSPKRPVDERPLPDADPAADEPSAKGPLAPTLTASRGE